MARNEEDEGRGPWLIISTVLVALVIVAALVLTLVNVFGGGDDVQPSPPPSSTSSDASKDAKGESVCGLKPGPSSQTTLTTAPEATWRLVDGVAAPKVKGAGPGQIDPEDQFGSCFAQSPTGAVVASANITASTTKPARQAKAYDQLAVPGPGRDKILEMYRAGELVDTSPSGVTIQLVGFHVDRYTPTEATIDLVHEVKTPEGSSYVAGPLDLRWVDGDWKIVVNDDGTVYNSKAVPDLSGYVLWSGA